jgi:hypothetical protein
MFSTALCLVYGTAFLLAGCGSSGQTTSATLARSTPSTAAVASSTASGIGGRVLKSNELAGFTSAGVAVYLTIQKWLSNPNDQQSAAQAAAEKAMLTRDGFRAGAVENLTGPAPDGGLSLVEQFRTAAAARAALAFYVSQQKESQVESTAGRFVAFKVPRIPGAVGYTLGGAGGGANVSFTQGDYYVLVGRQGGSPADIVGLNGAARRLYNRVAG